MLSTKIEEYSFLRGPIQLSIDITNKCNLRCLHCYNCSGENIYVKDELSDEALIDLINDVCEMQPFNVCFCGGETLLRKDILVYLIKKLRENNINSSLVSNGILLTKEVAKELKEAGIGNVQISLDGTEKSHDRLRGKDGSYKYAIKAIENLKEFSIKRNIAFSPTKWNINDFEEVLKISLELGVGEIRVQELMPIGRASVNFNILPNNSQYRKLKKEIDNIRSRLLAEGNELRIEWGDPIDHLIRYTEIDIFTYMFSIAANGAIKPSMYLPLSVGNIRKRSIIDYWSNGLYDIWKLNELRDMANKFKSVTDMESTNFDLPNTFIDEDIEFDIIEKEFLNELLMKDKR